MKDKKKSKETPEWLGLWVGAPTGTDLVCNRCETRENIKLPVEMRHVVPVILDFIKAHRKCKKKKA